MNEDRPDTTGETPSPAEMLAVAEHQQERTRNGLDIRPGLLFGAWGTAWLLGFGELFLTIGPAGAVVIPLWGALALFFACLAGAGTITAVTLIRVSQGLRGPSQRAGAMYGWSWTIAFGCLAVLITAVGRLGIDFEVYALLWSAGSGLLVGLLFLGGGALSNDWWQYCVGLWILLINAVGAFAGIPGHYLVMSLAGGGGFLLVALVLALRNAKRERR
ncbi:hypothetical protein FHX42_000111 [Saccharopolyspora lacisalsi]|uniref:Uncharacterized protein n=1 Tax=Halosaccharopolyspora lacisalsi TaxID=1000566 RepID=A0A839DLF4_9PSEU|nr:hypothetical protein [Halosaccharopolyspora lacisalsi]MBA8822782.1 hypothetical protein [Halosaccharopolyspora lacisalsi]